MASHAFSEDEDDFGVGFGAELDFGHSIGPGPGFESSFSPAPAPGPTQVSASARAPAPPQAQRRDAVRGPAAIAFPDLGDYEADMEIPQPRAQPVEHVHLREEREDTDEHAFEETENALDVQTEPTPQEHEAFRRHIEARRRQRFMYTGDAPEAGAGGNDDDSETEHNMDRIRKVTIHMHEWSRKRRRRQRTSPRFCFMCMYAPTDTDRAVFERMERIYQQSLGRASIDQIVNDIYIFYNQNFRPRIAGSPHWRLETIRRHFEEHTVYPHWRRCVAHADLSRVYELIVANRLCEKSGPDGKRMPDEKGVNMMLKVAGALERIDALIMRASADVNQAKKK